jgi:hypothetical protein
MKLEMNRWAGTDLTVHKEVAVINVLLASRKASAAMNKRKRSAA